MNLSLTQMPEDIIFIGINPAPDGKFYTYSAIDQKKRILQLADGSLEWALAYIGKQHKTLVAVTTPRSPNIGLMLRHEIRNSLRPQPLPGNWMNCRVCEYELRMRGINIPQTASQNNRCPSWMKPGFDLFYRLDNLGFLPYLPRDAAFQSMEVYPEASFSAFLGVVPYYKGSLEGRLQRQLCLFERDLTVPNPMDFLEEFTRHRLLTGRLSYESLYPPNHLDALVAAFTAWLAANDTGRVELVGNPEEGVIVLPIYSSSAP